MNETLSLSVIEEAIKGINGTVLAYGQTSSGTTHTMQGMDDGNQMGIIPGCIEDIYSRIENITNHAFIVCIWYMQIYNEKLTDLPNSAAELNNMEIMDGIDKIP